MIPMQIFPGPVGNCSECGCKCMRFFMLMGIRIWTRPCTDIKSKWLLKWCPMCVQLGSHYQLILC